MLLISYKGQIHAKLIHLYFLIRQWTAGYGLMSSCSQPTTHLWIHMHCSVPPNLPNLWNLALNNNNKSQIFTSRHIVPIKHSCHRSLTNNSVWNVVCVRTKFCSEVPVLVRHQWVNVRNPNNWKRSVWVSGQRASLPDTRVCVCVCVIVHKAISIIMSTHECGINSERLGLSLKCFRTYWWRNLDATEHHVIKWNFLSRRKMVI